MPNWTLRIIVGALGLWGLAWMLGLLAVLYRSPHVVTSEWVRVRSGFALDVLVPWDVVREVRPIGRTVTGTKSVQYEGDEAARTRFLSAAQSSRTNVTLEFLQPLEVEVAGSPEVIYGLRLWADDPTGFAVAVKLRLQQYRVSARH